MSIHRVISLCKWLSRHHLLLNLSLSGREVSLFLRNEIREFMKGNFGVEYRYLISPFLAVYWIEAIKDMNFSMPVYFSKNKKRERELVEDIPQF